MREKRKWMGKEIQGALPDKGERVRERTAWRQQ